MGRAGWQTNTSTQQYKLKNEKEREREYEGARERERERKREREGERERERERERDCTTLVMCANGLKDVPCYDSQQAQQCGILTTRLRRCCGSPCGSTIKDHMQDMQGIWRGTLRSLRLGRCASGMGNELQTRETRKLSQGHMKEKTKAGRWGDGADVLRLSGCGWF
jgi:hypothetical protein